MLSIDISFRFREIDFVFKAEIKRGVPHTFAVCESALADKLFWVLAGLDKDYKGTVSGEGLCFNASTWNNILALGDRTMFIRGSVYKNIYKALRLRTDKKTAIERAFEVIKLYDLQDFEKLNVKYLGDGELLRVALARAHYRKIGLLIAKECKIDFSKWKDSYIIEIT